MKETVFIGGHYDGIGCLLRFYPSGSVKSEAWFLNGELHRDGAPTCIEYFESGGREMEKWVSHGKYHRENGPAIIEYNPDGSIHHESWHSNNLSHREEEPARITYVNGKILCVTWSYHGKCFCNREEMEEFKLKQDLIGQMLPELDHYDHDVFKL